ncbi:DNA-3-methyladenine glycosylase [Dolosigranulum savutiense]|uniref:Putative 3-methyladenine DNA glycosylase n=1 Tax=Dolosigranulum savutiense TaxID=3110288 RepID=A0AB74TWK9_9LACT
MKSLLSPERPTVDVARDLLGCVLQKETKAGIVTGWIVDVEAYLGVEDLASHSYGGKKTPRLRAQYSQSGTIYLYQMRGHILLNIVTGDTQTPQGVMIRAIQPKSGFALIDQRRHPILGVDQVNGPGKLTQALGITVEDYGTSITEGSLQLTQNNRRFPQKIVALPRIGIPNKGEWTDKKLRFVVSGNPYISKQRKYDVDDEKYGWIN